MPRIALYPGSFDPPTNGHVDVMRMALALCDRLVIGIGVHAGKTAMLTVQERIELLTEVATAHAGAAGAVIEVLPFSNLVVDFASEVGATVLVRGVRDGSDLDDEMRMAGMNASLSGDLQTVLLPASAGLRHITATLVRQIATMGGDVTPFVPPAVAERLRRTYSSQQSS